jgi:putative N6-adenine-specific DNA methylase
MSSDIRSFFVMVAPGFEKRLEEEIRDVATYLKVQSEVSGLSVIKGGVEFDAPLAVGCELNYWLKTAGRVLLRLDSFVATTWAELRECISGLELPYLERGMRIAVEASSHKSRLNHKKQLKDAIERELKKKFSVLPVKKSDADVLLFFRWSKDKAQVSIDTSGEHLHRRGYRIHTEKGSLRETFAAALIKQLIDGSPPSKSCCLVDPMAGSGTFLSEAFLLNERSVGREFAFEHWSEKIQWENLENSESMRPAIFSEFVGVDRDEHCIDSMYSNIESSRFDGGDFRFVHQDFFSEFETEISTDETWVICNPPYNQRLKTQGRPVDFYRSLIFRISEVFRPSRCGLVLPQKFVKGVLGQSPDSWRRVSETPFSNNGIPVSFCVWHCGR